MAVDAGLEENLIIVVEAPFLKLTFAELLNCCAVAKIVAVVSNINKNIFFMGYQS
jgi:hypothetical protein